MTLERVDDYYIHSYETDFTTKLRFSCLNRYMQESAWKNAEQLGFGFSRLIQGNFAWVLTRMLITLEPLPGWNETIRIATWPSGQEGLFAFRDFQIFDQGGKELGRATSSWCVIDLVTRKPVPLQSAFENGLAELDQRLFPGRPHKIEALKRADSEWRTVVGYQDLDVNEHVTNSRYIDWIFESFDLGIFRERRLRSLAINFLAEALYQHEIVVKTEQISATEFRHAVFQINDRREICRAETVWE
ncbi:MAG: acyl-[acyl-carrier-protein] thioesterase [Fidelibacterota bacterium]